ncbi:hypothetical protein JZ751_013252 [Albula glossodonta]|uniref:Rab-GAP TBC domain-containing protein n=1 Tax=Albula glossodonta TaxID=121402 RepID=A0A8T2P2L7_9TELE|nr:hypothetical protein JZ751_013252 [Albula glossodonta]
MSLGRLLRRASSKASDLLTFNAGSGGSRGLLDGEIIFSKNNVCVHPTEPLPGLAEHHPGYLCVHLEKDEALGSTLILTWVPNSRIQRQDEEALRYITPESSPVRRNPRRRPRRAHSRPPPAAEEEEDEEGGGGAGDGEGGAESQQQQALEEGDEGSCDLSADEVSRDSTLGSDSDTFSSPFCLSPVSEALAESSGSVFLDNENRDMCDESMTHSASSASSLDSHAPSENSQSQGVRWEEQQKVMALEQLCGVFRVDLGHMRSLRLFFSDEACTCGQLVIASRESQYKILHFHHAGLDKLAEVFQQWKYCRETQLKDQVSDEKSCMQFSIRRPTLPSAETHPEERLYRRLDVATWLRHLNQSGQVEEEYKLRKAIFFGGIDPAIRGEVWPFLLHYYSCDSTSEEREAWRMQKRSEYQDIQQRRGVQRQVWGEAAGARCAVKPPGGSREQAKAQVSGDKGTVMVRCFFPHGVEENKRGYLNPPSGEPVLGRFGSSCLTSTVGAGLSMSPEEHSEFWRKIQFTVDKDVVRTDRSNLFFRGENNPNVEIMRCVFLPSGSLRILLNYAVYNPDMGYCQGMSDLVAPLLTEVQDESDTFWCFVGLMENTIFISSPRDEDMERQLMYLRELLRLMLPRFHQHLTQLGEDGLQLLFCHRWILLCFKREFPDTEALRMWEACWAHYQRKSLPITHSLHTGPFLEGNSGLPDLGNVSPAVTDNTLSQSDGVLESRRVWESESQLQCCPLWLEDHTGEATTDYFHLFLCVAIIVLYGEDVTEQQLATDQMLLHFSNLSMHMNGELVLRKARSLLYQFRLLPRIPCSLHDLCKLCGPGMWDSRYIPAVECSGEHPDTQSCPYGGSATPLPPPPSPLLAPPTNDGKRASKTRDIFNFRKQGRRCAFSISMPWDKLDHVDLYINLISMARQGGVGPKAGGMSQGTLELADNQERVQLQETYRTQSPPPHCTYRPEAQIETQSMAWSFWRALHGTLKCHSGEERLPQNSLCDHVCESAAEDSALSEVQILRLCLSRGSRPQLMNSVSSMLKINHLAPPSQPEQVAERGAVVGLENVHPLPPGQFFIFVILVSLSSFDRAVRCVTGDSPTCDRTEPRCHTCSYTAECIYSSVPHAVSSAGEAVGPEGRGVEKSRPYLQQIGSRLRPPLHRCSPEV